MKTSEFLKTADNLVKGDRDKDYGDKTESDFWIHILATGTDNYCKLVFEVPRLKRLVEKYKSTHSRMVGDRNASKCVLIPLNELFEKENVAV